MSEYVCVSASMHVNDCVHVSQRNVFFIFNIIYCLFCMIISSRISSQTIYLSYPKEQLKNYLSAKTQFKIRKTTNII